ncbi:MAG TPA: SMC-Scp complex subunit ScpB, partial [bacterium]
IAFRQPISRTEIDAIRGVHSGGVIKNLLERNLVAISGRSEEVGKPLLYGTTPEFLRYFGINDISELPKPKEIEEIMGKLDSDQEISAEIIKALADEEPVTEDENNGTAE